MKAKSLASIAGVIWLIAGFNVCRIGVVSWQSLESTTVSMIVGCLATLLLFSRMFVKMLFRNEPHTTRQHHAIRTPHPLPLYPQITRFAHLVISI